MDCIYGVYREKSRISTFLYLKVSVSLCCYNETSLMIFISLRRIIMMSLNTSLEERFNENATRYYGVVSGRSFQYFFNQDERRGSFIPGDREFLETLPANGKQKVALFIGESYLSSIAPEIFPNVDAIIVLDINNVNLEHIKKTLTPIQAITQNTPLADIEHQFYEQIATPSCLGFKSVEQFLSQKAPDPMMYREPETNCLMIQSSDHSRKLKEDDQLGDRGIVYLVSLDFRNAKQQSMLLGKQARFTVLREIYFLMLICVRLEMC